MHIWLAFLAGLFVVVGGVLIFSASLGIAYYGLALQIEAGLALILLIMAGIAAWLFYVGIKAQHKRIKTGKEALIGATGIAITDLKPKGEVRVLGEFWQATSKDIPITNGDPIEVVDMEGMFLIVRPSQQKA
jgi:membrane-bound serine protease (ClpP class)